MALQIAEACQLDLPHCVLFSNHSARLLRFPPRKGDEPVDTWGKVFDRCTQHSLDGVSAPGFTPRARARLQLCAGLYRPFRTNRPVFSGRSFRISTPK
ncbi:hypothetical protein CCHOA_01420 [Corynebacterium choanae]|uniref:Uncharacterized protein n=1 Tax=Corynebacterium choanae TaxID=1862358 RepID=A0A3G6J478_9CORY|nr:hypothetical protein CCHOA_01420 [Corynebacterium choanae]